MPKPPSRIVPDARLADSDRLLHDPVSIWPGTHVELDGARVHVRVTPAESDDAEPALFVHGLGGSAHNWTDFAGALRNRLDIEAIDLPGHGRSGPAPDDDYRLTAHARVVIAQIEQSGRGPVHLVGNSMGGAVSIVVATQRPDLVRTLTLISPAVPDNRLRIYPLRNDRRMALLVVPWLGEWVMKLMDARYAAEVRVAGTIKLCFADKSRYPEQRMKEAVAEAEEHDAMPWGHRAFLRSTRGLAMSQFFRNSVAWAAMRKISAPTLVVWGDTDRLVAPDLAQYVAAAIPDSRLLFMNNIGHTAMMEDPETTARAMLALLEDSTAARKRIR